MKADREGDLRRTPGHDGLTNGRARLINGPRISLGDFRIGEERACPGSGERFSILL
jgi:hypothetical protein